MKSLLVSLLLVLPVFSEENPWTYHKNKVIYSAEVNQTKFKVYFSTGPFDQSRHKIVPAKVVGDRLHLPKVDGHEAAGLDGQLPSTKSKFPHLTRLAVSFGDKVVEAPAKLISHVFMPHPDTTFDSEYQNGRVAISSDGKTVTVELSISDGAGADVVAFTFTADGKCKIGLPEVLAN
ncbi:MAG: hypothetical protein PVJ98_05760 [Akkermansiaceae bacterium]|jgi:hypothetical protein